MQWLSQGLDDLRVAVRSCAKQPVFALMVIGMLGLGIGASAAALSSLDRAVLRPFALAEGKRFAYITMFNAEQGWHGVPSGQAIERWRATVPLVEAFEIYMESLTTLQNDGVPEVVPSASMSPGLPALVGLRPLVGRAMGPTDVADGAAPVVMISESFWRRRFGASPDVVSRVVQFGSTSYTVVGVWPQTTRVHPREQADVFFVRRESALVDDGWAYVVAKLAPGVRHADVGPALFSQMTGLSDVRHGLKPSVTSPTDFLNRAYVRGLWLVFAASILLMLVGIANASNLLLARAVARSRELGVRLALGGTAWRLVRMFLAEGAVLSVAGAALAVGIAWVIGRMLMTLAVGNIPEAHFGGVDDVVFVFAGLGAAFSTLVCGIVPVIHSRTTDVRRLGGGDGQLRVVGTTSRVRQALVSLQAAIGVVLIAGAILTARSQTNLTTSDPGFVVHELVTMVVVPPSARYPTPEARQDVLARIRAAVSSIPGVSGITTADMPMFHQSTQDGVPYLDGQAPALGFDKTTTGIGAAPGYFDVMGIPLRQGRLFHDDEPRGSVIVNESFARAHGGNVVGRQLYQPRRDVAHDQLKPEQIVGVVGDIRAAGAAVDEPSPVQVYRPSTDTAARSARFMVRTTGDPAAVLAAARQRVATIDPRLPLLNADTGTAIFQAQTAQFRFVAVLLGSLAIFGVVLAVGGVYGTVTIEVRRRMREVGLRVALGATGRQVVRLIVHTSMRPVFWGAFVGVLGWLWASTQLSALLFRIEARDASSTIAAVTVLGAVAALACIIPARRASRVDPAITLRVD